MKKVKTPTAVTSAVLTLITIFFWAGFEIFRSFTTKPTPTVPEEVILPLDPTLDTSLLNSLSQRLVIPDTNVGNFQVAATSTPTPAPTATPAVETPTASASAIP